MAQPVAEAFLKAAKLVLSDGNRKGNLLQFRSGEQIVYGGDIHGNRQNLARIISYSDVSGNANRRLVLQEVIHADSVDAAGADRSFDALLRAVRLKLACPERVFFLLGNHDLAEITCQEITKQGRGMCKSFNDALEASFGQHAGEVRSALTEFLRALPLAGRCHNGMLMTHSLPSPERMHLVDWTVLDRPYAPEDFRRGGTVYEWTWGRAHTAEQLDQIAARLGVRQFLLGHQPKQDGYEIVHGRAVVLSSEHAYGKIMTFDAGVPVPDADLEKCIRAIASL